MKHVKPLPNDFLGTIQRLLPFDEQARPRHDQPRLRLVVNRAAPERIARYLPRCRRSLRLVRN